MRFGPYDERFATSSTMRLAAANAALNYHGAPYPEYRQDGPVDRQFIAQYEFLPAETIAGIDFLRRRPPLCHFGPTQQAPSHFRRHCINPERDCHAGKNRRSRLLSCRALHPAFRHLHSAFLPA